MNKRPILTFLGFFIFCVYLVLLANSLTRRAASGPVMYAESNDSSLSLEILGRTTWTNHNGFQPYGPLYYRLAHTLENLDLIRMATKEEDGGVRDKSGHLALMLVSLFSLGILSLWLVSLHAPTWFQGFAASLLLYSFFGGSELWMDFAVDAHPDVLMTLFVALATWFTIAGDRRSLLTAGIFWGLAMMSKPTAITFAGGAIFFLLIQGLWKKKTTVDVFKDIAALGGTSLIAYFATGFPQSADLVGLVDSLMWHATATVRSSDWTYWPHHTLAVGLLPALTLTALYLIFEPTEKSGQETNKSLVGNTQLLGFIIPLVGLLALFPMAYHSHRQHYVLPILGAVLGALSPLLKNFSIWARAHGNKRLVPALKFAGIMLLIGTYADSRKHHAPNTGERLYSRFAFQAEAEKVAEELAKHLAKGKTAIADPYVPIEFRKYRQKFLNYDEAKLGQTAADIYVSSRWYYERFLSGVPTDWDLLSLQKDDFMASHRFYKNVETQKTLVDGKRRPWKLVFQSPVGWRIWERRK